MGIKLFTELLFNITETQSIMLLFNTAFNYAVIQHS